MTGLIRNESGVENVPPPSEEAALDIHETSFGTYSLAAGWVIVFIAMGIAQGRFPIQWNPLALSILPPIGHRFGDLTAGEFLRGQVWRTVTATFVHYNILHITLNVIGLYALGRIVESWYGAGPLLAIYVLIAALGNTIAALSRWSLGLTLDLHSGGGSGVGFGLITLIAVGGWMSRTRFGDYVRSYMIVLLILNAALCYVLRRSVDNYGHAGGVIAGALTGLAHPYWRRWGRGRAAWATGTGAVAVLILCAIAQARADRIEARQVESLLKLQSRRAAQLNRIRQSMAEIDVLSRRQKNLLATLLTIDAFYLELVRRGPNPPAFPPPRDVLVPPHSSRRITTADFSLLKIRELLAAQLAVLKADPLGLDQKPTDGDFRRVVSSVERALTQAPTPGETAAYQRAFIALARRLSNENQAAVERFKKLDEEAAKLK